jgi:uncharacterized Zn finger protein
MNVPYDPFNPENVPMNCPSCQKKPSRNKAVTPVDETTRKCSLCGRVEHWEQPSKKAHGERRYVRLVSRQRKKFGDIDMILFQWIAEPDQTLLGPSAE